MLLELLLAQALIAEPDMDKVNQHVAMANSRACALEAGLAFAQYSTETAEQSAKFAVISCRRVNQNLPGQIGQTNNFLDSIEQETALRIAQWRVRAAANGPGEYKKIAEKYGFKNEFEFD